MSFKDHQIEPISLLKSLNDLLELELGEYKINDYSNNPINTHNYGSIKNIPSIWITPPQIPSNREVVKDSGIECVISRTPQQTPEKCANNQDLIKKAWKIILTQYNKNLTTEKAIEKIINSFSVSLINVREQQERKEGLFLEQAKLIITDYKLLK